MDIVVIGHFASDIIPSFVFLVNELFVCCPDCKVVKIDFIVVFVSLICDLLHCYPSVEVLQQSYTAERRLPTLSSVLVLFGLDRP